jgi:hypothetical protein
LRPTKSSSVTYDELTRHIGEPQRTGVKTDGSDTLITVFHWACGCRAYEWPDHIEIEPCAPHRALLRSGSGE